MSRAAVPRAWYEGMRWGYARWVGSTLPSLYDQAKGLDQAGDPELAGLLRALADAGVAVRDCLVRRVKDAPQ